MEREKNVADAIFRKGSAYIVCGFFVVLLFFGFFVHQDYGITWDEKMQYMIGSLALQYFREGGSWIDFREGMQYFGSTFEIVLSVAEKSLGLRDAREIFFLRHFLIFLSYYAGVVALFFLGKKSFGNNLWALLTCILFVFSPRIFGHAFYNSKDIPAMAFFIVVWTLSLLMQRQSYGSILLHAFVCAIVVTIRLTGIFLLPLTVLFLALPLLVSYKSRECWVHVITSVLLFSVLFPLISIVLWPYLWHQPLQHFLQAYAFMSSRPFDSFFMGQSTGGFIWYWIPVWILISTPIVISLFFVIGLSTRLWHYIRFPKNLIQGDSMTLLFLAWFFGPLSAVILLRSGMYDDWRHLFFIYPAFVLLAVDGLRRSLAYVRQTRHASVMVRCICILVAISMLQTAYWVVRNHPYESVYFSIPSRFVQGSFHLDYWGLSMRDGIAYALDYDSAGSHWTFGDKPLVSVYPTSSAGWSAMNMLTTEQRRRLVMTAKPEEAQYIVDNFRGNNYQELFPDEWKIHSIFVGGNEILAVYKNPTPDLSILTPANQFPPEGIVFIF
jgi:hypothetical protein